MITIQQIEDKIHVIRDEKVIIDKDVAGLYGLETKRVNEAVANNPEKFPIGYIVHLDKEEWEAIRSKFSTKKNPIIELFEDGLSTNETETTIELNFALLKLKHKVKRK